MRSPESLDRALCGLRKWRDTESGEPITEEGYSLYRREDVGTTSAPWIARQFEAWATHESVKSSKLTIPAKRVFDIKQGVRLGNDVFIVGKEYVQRLPRDEGRFFRPAVMNLSISEASLNDDYYVFYPYSDGLPNIQTEDDLVAHVPTYFEEFLLPTKTKLANRKSLAKANLNWWELLWHRSWQTKRSPKIEYKYFDAGRSFAFKYVSIQISGGQWDLSNKYTKNLLIPNLAKLEPAPLEELVQTGVRISEGKIENWSHVDKIVSSILNR
jgi:hypothetical protein